MSTSERDSRDGDYALRHAQSATSDASLRALVPMWDSSDPERCPPPLPLNPTSPKSFSSRAGTSSAIQSAHAALSERARESAVVKQSPHRRMQSLQPTSVRDMSLMLEHNGGSSGNISPSRSPDKFHRPETPIRARDESRYTDRESSTGSPTPGPSLTPIVRPIVRRPPPQCILGENTPPQSSTMLALQNMGNQSPSPVQSLPLPQPQPQPQNKEPETPLSNVTNNGSALVRHPQSLDQLSNQILSLTNIATSLQKEMAQLSRRSRDNATDLLSLKEATNTRDEDIRKSLRELIHTNPSERLSRDPFGGYYLDNKPHNVSPNNTRSAFHLPRIPSPKSFSDTIDRASISTPSLAGSEAPASVALLERIIREMGTKEGQESLLGRLIDVSNKLAGMATAAKVDELVEHIRNQSENAIVLDDGARSRNMSFDEESSQMTSPDRPRSGPVLQRVQHLMRSDSRRNSEPSNGRGAGLLNDDLISIIRSVKDSVAQGGGLTAEVKALVRELRGEVLGMGREIGRRLEQVAAHKPVDDQETPSKDDVARVIDEGLEQMKDQLNHVLREHRRASAASSNTQKTAVDYQEIYNAMRAALQDNEANQMPDLSREDVIQAVKDAWENYKPEIEFQQLGLEREEVLDCLKEGLRQYAPDDRAPSATRDEVFTAVVEGLRHFVPPQVDTPASLSRDEIIEAVRDCLEEFEFPVAASAVGGSEITHDDVVHAVREGLHDLDLTSSRALMPATLGNEEISDKLKEITDLLRGELKAASDEAKEHAALSGRGTERVLDATKEGLENLRQAMEDYVDRAAESGLQEEFMDDVIKSLDDFKDDMASILTKSNEDARGQLQSELEALREVVNNSMVPAPQSTQLNNLEVLEALNTGFNNLRQEILRPRAETSEILDALNDGLNDLRAGMDRVTNKPADLTANDEILDALKTGLDSVRSDLENIRDTNDKAVAILDEPLETTSGDVLDALKTGLDSVRADIEALRESTLEKAVATVEPTDNNEILEALKGGLDALRSDIEGLREADEKAVVPIPETSSSNDEILDALKTGLESVRSDIEALRESNNERAVAAVDSVPEYSDEKILDALKSGLDSVRSDIESLRDSNNERALAAIPSEEDTDKALVPADMLKQDDIKTLETLIADLRTKVDGMEPESENIQKDDLTRMEDMIRNVQTAVEELSSREVPAAAPPAETATAPSADKEDLARMEEMIRNIRDTVGELSSREPVAATRAIAPDAEGDAEAAPSTNKDVTHLEEMIRNIRDTVGEISTREPTVITRTVDSDGTPLDIGDAASKDDVQAIETILRNTKGRLDDLIDGESAVRKEHLDNIETLLLETRESMGTLNTALDTVPRKEEISTLETLLTQITAGLDEIKERAIKENENPDKVSKSDVDSVEAAVLELKTSLEGVAGTDFAIFASKEDISNLETVVKAFEEKLDTSVDSTTKAVAVRDEAMTGVGERVESLETIVKGFEEKLQSSVESSTQAVTVRDEAMAGVGERVESLETVVKSFEEKLDSSVESSNKAVAVRDEEMGTVGDRVTEVKTFLEEFQEAIKSKLDEGSTGVEAVGKLLESMGEKIDKNETIGDDLKDMFETMKSEFEDSKAVISGVKVESNEKVAEATVKFEEATAALATKIEDKIGEVVAKYDELQTMLDEKSKVTEAHVASSDAAVVGTKAVTDELKLLIDTLGSTVTDSLEKMEEASKTVFSTVEDLATKTEENHTENKTEHEQTREKISEALSVVEGLKGEAGEFQPKVLEAVKDILVLAGEHFEHSKTFTADVQDKIPEELKMLLPPEKYDNTQAHEKLDKLAEQLPALKYDDAEVKEKLEKLLEQLIEQKYDDGEIRDRLEKLVEHVTAEKYDDAEIREKFDKLVQHVTEQKYDDTVVQEKLTKIIDEKYDDGQVREKLDKLAEQLLEQKYDDAPVHEKLTQIIDQKYDDTEVREKLDTIVSHKYDDAAVREKLDVIVGHKYDDTEVREKLELIMADKYDDTVLRDKLDLIYADKYDDAVVRDKLDVIVSHKYDDAEVREKLDVIASHKYDDAEVREKLDVIVGHKYDDTEIREKLDTIVSHKYDDGQVREKLDVIVGHKYDDADVREMLDTIMSHKYDDTPIRDKLDLIYDDRYDDAPVQEKLDKLVEHTSTADQAFSRLDTLDQVHASVVKTAADIAEFLSNQTQRNTQENEDREKSLQETIVATERKLAEKEQVEASVLSLREEEEKLRQSILSLRAEQETLVRQKTRLTADVSSLETAMRLRKEDLYDMETRAEGLERRILEGVMDHSRVLLMSKASKGGDAMSRKRVKKPANETDSASTPKKPIVGIPLARRSMASPAQTGNGRRIVSLSQMNNNVATTGFKRSQSVRTPAGRGGKAYRKRSWGGDAENGLGDDDDNVDVEETVEELDEQENRPPVADSDALDDNSGGDEETEGETLRRSSKGTVIINGNDMEGQ